MAGRSPTPQQLLLPADVKPNGPSEERRGRGCWLVGLVWLGWVGLGLLRLTRSSLRFLLNERTGGRADERNRTKSRLLAAIHHPVYQLSLARGLVYANCFEETKGTAAFVCIDALSLSFSPVQPASQPARQPRFVYIRLIGFFSLSLSFHSTHGKHQHARQRP